jgi:hypothetical protein
MDKQIVKKGKETGIVAANMELLKKNATLGISGVDPSDVMPAEMKLAHGSSRLDQMTTDQGAQVRVGQFFYRGDRTIHETVKGYILCMAKVRAPFPDRKTGEYGRVYRMIGVLEDMKSPFTIYFKGAAIPSVKSLLSHVFSQRRGVYSFKVEIVAEPKQTTIDGQIVNYLAPAIKILENVEDQKVLRMLEVGVGKYEYLVKMVQDGDAEVIENRTMEDNPAEEEPDTTKPMNEVVNPEDIPF